MRTRQLQSIHFTHAYITSIFFSFFCPLRVVDTEGASVVAYEGAVLLTVVLKLKSAVSLSASAQLEKG